MSSYDIQAQSLLPKVAQWVERICLYNSYQKYPLVSILFCTATPLWIIFFACAMLIARKKTRYLLPVSGTMVIWFSYLLGPCTLARYMLPLFCLAPVLLILAFSIPDKN